MVKRSQVSARRAHAADKRGTVRLSIGTVRDCIFVLGGMPSRSATAGAMRGPAFFAYADNYLIDVKFGITAEVGLSPRL